MIVAAGGRARIARPRTRYLPVSSAGLFAFQETTTMTGRTGRLRRELGDELAELLAGCARGDEHHWNRLLEAVRHMAMDLARSTYHMGLEDAEDLAQLVQIRVTERLPQLRSLEAFPLW